MPPARLPRSVTSRVTSGGSTRTVASGDAVPVAHVGVVVEQHRGRHRPGGRAPARGVADPQPDSRGHGRAAPAPALAAARPVGRGGRRPARSQTHHHHGELPAGARRHRPVHLHRHGPHLDRHRPGDDVRLRGVRGLRRLDDGDAPADGRASATTCGPARCGCRRGSSPRTSSSVRRWVPSSLPREWSGRSSPRSCSSCWPSGSSAAWSSPEVECAGPSTPTSGPTSSMASAGSDTTRRCAPWRSSSSPSTSRGVRRGRSSCSIRSTTCTWAPSASACSRPRAPWAVCWRRRTSTGSRGGSRSRPS